MVSPPERGHDLRVYRRRVGGEAFGSWQLPCRAAEERGSVEHAGQSQPRGPLRAGPLVAGVRTVAEHCSSASMQYAHTGQPAASRNASSCERTRPSSGARRSRASTTMLTDCLTTGLHVRRGHQRRRARMKSEPHRRPRGTRGGVPSRSAGARTPRAARLRDRHARNAQAPRLAPAGEPPPPAGHLRACQRTCRRSSSRRWTPAKAAMSRLCGGSGEAPPRQCASCSPAGDRRRALVRLPRSRRCAGRSLRRSWSAAARPR
jgi:hypothetical protein